MPRRRSLQPNALLLPVLTLRYTIVKACADAQREDLYSRALTRRQIGGEDTAASGVKQCYFSYDFLVIVIVIVTHFLSF